MRRNSTPNMVTSSEILRNSLAYTEALDWAIASWGFYLSIDVGRVWAGAWGEYASGMMGQEERRSNEGARRNKCEEYLTSEKRFIHDGEAVFFFATNHIKKFMPKVITPILGPSWKLFFLAWRSDGTL